MKKTVCFSFLILFFLIMYVIFTGCEEKKKRFRIGVLQWTEEIKPFTETYKGLMDSLNDKGYNPALNLDIDYMNARQDKQAALAAAGILVDKSVDLIVALGTGSSLAALEATETRKIPIVFSIAGAPIATGIIDDFHHSGKNITGVSMKVPVKDQFLVLREILPEIRKIGILFCTEMPQASATGKEAQSAALEYGWASKSMVLTKNELERLDRAVQDLAEQVDAIYIPTDPVLSSKGFLEQILSITDEEKIPVIGVARKFVENGMLAAVHCDFYEIGRQTADPVIRVLSGEAVQTIHSQEPMTQRISLNLKKARQLGIHIPRNVILKADDIFD